MSEKNMHIETKLIHSGEPSPRISGAVNMPVFQSSTFEFTGEKNYDDVRYIRLNNTPNHVALNEKLASLENAEAAIVCASGMAAISTGLLAVLKSGDHILVQDCLYGGTHSLVTKEIRKYGIEYDFIDALDPASWEKSLRTDTRAIYVETITNPLIQVMNLDAVAEFAANKGLVSMIDNTFASPVNFRPSEHGFDLSFHSASKYLNGHTDLVAGAVIGRKNLVDEIRHLLNLLGGTLDPHACFLLQRGMRTLALRIKHQNSSALEIARFLQSHEKVVRVNYPGLADSPCHQTASRLLDGFGGMLSFELEGGVEEAERFVANTRLAICAPSLGGCETLVTIPVTTSHASLTVGERKAAGIADGLVRMSVGIENTGDLIEDFSQALEA